MNELLISAALILLPNILVALIVFIMRYTRFREIALRAGIAFTAFWLIYCVGSSIVFYLLGVQPNLVYSSPNLSKSALKPLAVYIGSLTMYSFTLTITYLIFMFPFVFFLAPLIGVLILLYVVKRKGIKDVTFWIDLKPKKLVGWEEEKEVLKLLIALLPVSLYFLITLLKLLQLELDPHVVGSTWLGWVLEIYMLFLLSFIVAVNLLYTSRVYHGNKFVGETIRRNTFNNLLSISIVLSSVSLILFVQIYRGIEYLFIYFALYYVAITIVFLSFFKIMEPASVYIFAKILTFIRDKDRLQKLFDLRTAGFGVLVGALTALISLLYILYTGPLTFNWAHTNVGLDELMNACSLYQSPYLDDLNILNILISLGSLQRFFEIAIILGLIYVFRNTFKVKFFVAGVYVGIFKMITDYFLLQRGASKAWTTAVFSSLNIGSLNILVLRFAYLPLTTNQFIVIPMLLLKLLATLLVFTVLVYLKFGKLVQFTDVEAGHQIKYICEPEPDRITPNSLIKLKIAKVFEDKVPEDLKQIVEFFKTKTYTFQELKEKLGMPEEKLKKILRYLYENYIIDIYDVEFKIVTPTSVIEGIYIVNTDGIALYSQSFGEVKVEPLLISGMLSAITSFVKETTSSQQYLQAIDHGDVVLMIEYGEGFFVTLLANRETPELRMRLREFVKRFQEQYGEVLKQWSGDQDEFKGTEQLVKEIFEITPESVEETSETQ